MYSEYHALPYHLYSRSAASCVLLLRAQELASFAFLVCLMSSSGFGHLALVL